MSKLEDNERWKSKLILTEHAEGYVQQHNPTPAKIITAEERTMLRDYLLLPHMVTMVQKSLDDLKHSHNILNRLYLMAGEYVMGRITQDLYQLRRELRQRNIKVLSEEQSDFVIYHRFICRGYEERFGMTRDVMKAEISLRLTRYIAEAGGLLKKGST
ncbi:hypothetical protein [Paenibacillus rhizophilus]|uniref:Uncharacterized protein n=1 Tax=Paenibacillus rhizophilus TaxID=1850366 RepID=A0A3N9P6K0_9BACL|nr:hypothetical protein [Paenibacillus rhizophilus]RQW11861.1 hypothetical protein EH198_09300 [Paenibacillus rhizophilus]